MKAQVGKKCDFFFMQCVGSSSDVAEINAKMDNMMKEVKELKSG